METLQHFLWPVVMIGGLGAFIDFLIGKAGQMRAKDFLLGWWVRFDDVRWKNFGREEGLFAGRLIDKWFGGRILSSRRIASALIIFFASLVLGYLHFLLSPNSLDIKCLYCDAKLYIGVVVLIVFFLGFSLSCSFTRFIAFRVSYLCGDGQLKNFVLFIMMLIINYIMLVI
jgi:hypothetical protein